MGLGEPDLGEPGLGCLGEPAWADRADQADRARNPAPEVALPGGSVGPPPQPVVSPNRPLVSPGHLGFDARDAWQSKDREALDRERLFDVSPLSDEFVTIRALFNQTLGAANLDRVHRVENGLQHETYSAYKQCGEGYGQHFHHVRLLFHCTSAEAVQSIIQSNTAGFLPKLAGSTSGAFYGDGTYFAHDASYSDNASCRLASGQNQMLIAEVVVGRGRGGIRGTRSAPCCRARR